LAKNILISIGSKYPDLIFDLSASSSSDEETTITTGAAVPAADPLRKFTTLRYYIICLEFLV